MRYYTQEDGRRFRASSHTAAHKFLCGLLSVDGTRSMSAWTDRPGKRVGDSRDRDVEVHASLYGDDFIRDAAGRVRKDWPESTGRAIRVVYISDPLKL